MLTGRLQRLTTIVGLVLLAFAFRTSASTDEAAEQVHLYLTNSQFRRRELEASLVDKNNAYSSLRLAHYATAAAGDWDDLPVWNPPTEPLIVAELAAPGGARRATRLGRGARALALPATDRPSFESLRALGEQAFFRYPMQIASGIDEALRSAETAARYGLWLDPERGVGGIVRAKMADGSTSWSMTCATCHADRSTGALEVGVPNAALDWGRMAAESDTSGDRSHQQMLLAWGPGRVDVSTPDGTEPIRISDLRPVRWLTHLHQTATVEQHDLTSLAIRIETLIITGHDQVIRPPRDVAMGLAVYLWSLAPGAPRSASTPEEKRGQGLFDSECRDCHGGQGYTGPPVPLDVVSTDRRIGESRSRGTGMYRVPSLRGVSTRGPLLHDGSVCNLAGLFDPERTEAHYRGGRLGPGPIKGHIFGLDRSPVERSDLLAFLATL